MTQTVTEGAQQRGRTAAATRRGRARRVTLGRLVVGVIIVVGLGAALTPVYWMLATSFKGPLEATSLDPTLWPHSPTPSNYIDLFTGALPFGRFLVNSVLTSIAAALVALLVATLAAYSFSRGRYRLRDPLSLVVLATQMLPFVVLIGPLYLLLLWANLLNTYLGLIIGYTTFAVPFAAWMMKGFIDAVPREVEEAARIDGYSRVGILGRVVVPLTIPGLVTTGVFVFMNAWNNLLYPLTLMTTNEKLTLPPGILRAFTGQLKTDWGGMMAAACITSVPILIAFFAVQRSMIKGMTSGAVTGT